MAVGYTIFPLGDAALTVDFGNRIDEPTSRKVLQLFHRLQHLSPFIRDLVPAYGSLTICYDVMALKSKEKTAYEVVKETVEPLLNETSENEIQGRKIRIPVCYAARYAPDLLELALQKNLTPAEVIQLHTSATYRVYMIGFLPGFPYLGKVDERIATPRRSQPRTAVPAGAVGIAGEQTGIYPLASPGGWNLIGQTPLRLFDATKQDVVLLQPGDEVNFYTITEDEFIDYQGRHS
jgi:inhibitor of KinA